MADASIIIEIKAEVAKLKKDLIKSQKEIKKFSKKTKVDMKKADNSMNGLMKTISKMPIVALSSFTAVGVFVGKFVREASQNFLKYEQGIISLNIQTGGSADSMIDSLKKASNSMVADVDLIANANKALALGISQNNLPKLMEVASARSKIMGITVTQAFQDITTGIGRGSRLILDNLGIILDLDKAYTNYAISIGKTKEQLTELEKKQALENQVIAETEGLLFAMKFAQDSTTNSLQRLNASLKNLGVDSINALKEAINSIIDFNNEIVGTVAGVSKVDDEFSNFMIKVSADLTTLDKFWADQTEAIRGVGQELFNLNDILQTGTIGGQDVREDVNKIALIDQRNKLDQESLKLLRLKNKLSAKEESLPSGVSKEGREKILGKENDRIKNQQRLVNALRRDLEEAEAEDRIAFDNKRKRAVQQGMINKQNIDGEKKVTSSIAEEVEKRSIEFQKQTQQLKILGETRSELDAQAKAQEGELADSIVKPEGLEKVGILVDLFGELVSTILPKVGEEIKENAKIISDGEKVRKFMNEDFKVLKKRLEDDTEEVDNLSKAIDDLPDQKSIDIIMNISRKGGGFPNKVRDFFGGKKHNDFVMRPGQSPVSFSPSDTLIGVKDPNKLGGGSNITINIGEIHGTDPTDMADALESKLMTRITI